MGYTCVDKSTLTAKRNSADSSKPAIQNEDSIIESIADIFSESQLQALSRDAPTPLYFRLHSLLKTAILNGSIDNGAQIPTEQKLGEIFGVSRITAKRALDELATENLVERRRGKGTHVTYDYKPDPVKAPLIGMLQQNESMARHSDVEVLECKRMKPPARIRELLGMRQNEKALYILRVRSREGQPFGLYLSWTSSLEKAVKKTDFTRASRLDIFRKQGLDISHVTQTITAVAASAELAVHLEQEEGAPLLSMVRHSFDMKNGKERLVDYVQVYYHPDRFHYRMDHEVDDAG